MSSDRFPVSHVADKIAAGSAGLRILGRHMLQDLTKKDHRKTRPDSTSPWFNSIGLAVAVGIAYFSAAQLSLAVIAKSDGLALFWLAGGVSSGVLIALGCDARLPVASATIIATIIVHLMNGRNIWVAAAFALCNVSETLVTAWLIERYFGSGFSLGRLRNVEQLASHHSADPRGGSRDDCCRHEAQHAGLGRDRSPAAQQ